jgi:hypothetical protein
LRNVFRCTKCQWHLPGQISCPALFPRLFLPGRRMGYSCCKQVFIPLSPA